MVADFTIRAAGPEPGLAEALAAVMMDCVAGGASITPNLGLYSIGMGYQPRATATAATAIGAYTHATGDYALALGSYTEATASHAIAIGTEVHATGIYSIAIGGGADTNGKDGAMVIGDDTYFATAHAPNGNCLVTRFTGNDGSVGEFAYKFMTGYPEDTSPYVYLKPNDNAWRSSCSRDLKENFMPVDPEWLLGRVRNLPITQWNYKTADPSVKFIGPVAEDFWDAFHLGGTDNKGINSFAIEGVSLAAVKALEARTVVMREQIDQRQLQQREPRRIQHSSAAIRPQLCVARRVLAPLRAPRKSADRQIKRGQQRI